MPETDAARRAALVAILEREVETGWTYTQLLLKPLDLLADLRALAAAEATIVRLEGERDHWHRIASRGVDADMAKRHLDEVTAERDAARAALAENPHVDCDQSILELQRKNASLREAMQLLQGFDFKLDESPHGQEIRRRALEALTAFDATATATENQIRRLDDLMDEMASEHAVEVARLRSALQQCQHALRVLANAGHYNSQGDALRGAIAALAATPAPAVAEATKRGGDDDAAS